MNKLDKDYQALLQDILDNGVTKQDRTGTGTISVFGRQIRHNMKDGFPLLTTKKMPFKTIVTELLWFLRGDTNIKFLVDNNCHIWDGDAYKNYLKWFNEQSKVFVEQGIVREPWTKEQYIEQIKLGNVDPDLSELGPIYGKQWRKWSEKEYYDGIDGWKDDELIFTKKIKNGIDQIQNLINDLKTNPDSRRLMVNAWNVGELDQMVLPPCHYGFQVYTRELSLEERNEWFIQNWCKGSRRGCKDDWKDFELDQQNVPKRAISLMWNQRSVDTFLGLPFNIASYGLLLEIIAKEVNMVPEELIGNLGDVHLYSNHIEQAKEQIGRELSREERYNLMPSITGHSEKNIETRKKINNFEGNIPGVSYHEEWLDSFSIPKRTREPYPLPKINFNTEWWDKPFFEAIHSEAFCKCLLEEDIQLYNYQSHPAIKAPLSN